MNFIWLIFAHFVGDIALQSEWQANNKKRYWYVMLSHCMIWTASICVALQFLGLFEYWKVAFLLLGHAVSDEWKCRQPHERQVWDGTTHPIRRVGGDVVNEKNWKTVSNWWMIYPDQAWHLAQLAIVYFA